MGLISDNEVKSRLFPPSPLVGFIEWLIEYLPRKRYNIKTYPMQDINEVDLKKGFYKAIGNSPQFILRSERSFESGWYYIEAAVTRNSGNREAKIVAVQKGKIETTKIMVPSNLRGSIREVIYIPNNTVELFWSPMSSIGFFSQSQILLHKIGFIESLLRRVFRIIFDFWRFRGTASKIWTIARIIKGILHTKQAYSETAELRFKRLSGADYEEFLRHHERIGRKNSRRIRKKISNFPVHPMITLIIVLDMTNSIQIRKTIDSIINQLYPNWELLLVVNSNADVYELVSEYETKFKNITAVFFNNSTNYSEALNQALIVASGEFFAVIGQYDQLASHALFHIVKEIVNNPNTMMIYTDSDCVDIDGLRSNPCFKPDWNLDMLYSLDYIDNLCFYRTQRVRDMEGYKSKFEGAEEYELTLQYTHTLIPETIIHISKILYHKYTLNLFEPSKKIGRISSHKSAKKALESLLAKKGCLINDGMIDGLFYIRHPIPIPNPLVSIIIPTRDQVEIFRVCIESIIEKTAYDNYEIIVIDNQSEKPETHAYFEEIKSYSRIKIYQDNRVFNYSILNNNALKYTEGDVIVLLNNDIEIISHNWLEEMVSHAIRPEIGAVGAKLLYPNGKVQHIGVIIGIGGVAGHGQKFIDDDDVGYCYRAAVTHNVSAVTAACLVVRKDIFVQVGGLDENLAVAFNDVDFCLKIRDAGYLNLFTPNAKLFHHESISRGHDDTSEKHKLFLKEFDYMQKKWNDKLKNDPAYNNNLTLEFENFTWKIS